MTSYSEYRLSTRNTPHTIQPGNVTVLPMLSCIPRGFFGSQRVNLDSHRLPRFFRFKWASKTGELLTKRITTDSQNYGRFYDWFDRIGAPCCGAEGGVDLGMNDDKRMQQILGFDDRLPLLRDDAGRVDVGNDWFFGKPSPLIKRDPYPPPISVPKAP